MKAHRKIRKGMKPLELVTKFSTKAAVFRKTDFSYVLTKNFTCLCFGDGIVC